MKITLSDSAYQITLLYKQKAPINKNVEFCTFAKKDISNVCFFACDFQTVRGNKLKKIGIRSNSNRNYKKGI